MVLKLNYNILHKYLYVDCQISLYDEPFLSYGPSLGKMHQMTPRWPWYIQVKKYTYARKLHPRGANCIQFALLRAVLELRSISGKEHRMTQNDLQMFKVKMPICMLYILPKSKFSSVSLYDLRFRGNWELGILNSPNEYKFLITFFHIQNSKKKKKKKNILWGSP